MTNNSTKKISMNQALSELSKHFEFVSLPLAKLVMGDLVATDMAVYAYRDEINEA